MGRRPNEGPRGEEKEEEGGGERGGALRMPRLVGWMLGSEKLAGYSLAVWRRGVSFFFPFTVSTCMYGKRGVGMGGCM